MSTGVLCGRAQSALSASEALWRAIARLREYGPQIDFLLLPGGGEDGVDRTRRFLIR